MWKQHVFMIVNACTIYIWRVRSLFAGTKRRCVKWLGKKMFTIC